MRSPRWSRSASWCRSVTTVTPTTARTFTRRDPFADTLEDRFELRELALAQRSGTAAPPVNDCWPFSGLSTMP